MAIKAEYHDEKKKLKHFTGLPKSFELTTESGSTLKAAITATGKAFKIDTSASFCPKGLRDIASHFAELADVMEGKAA